MLWIAIDLSQLALESFAQSTASSEPWAVTDGDCVLACNQQARDSGVRNGMRLPAACALVPQLHHRPRDHAAETAALSTLAAWAAGFTPNVSLEPPQALLLDIEGSLKLFGGIRAVLQALRHGLNEMGYSAAIACAPTCGAALLLARGGNETVVSCKRGLEAVIVALPLSVLQCEVSTLKTLAAAGLRSIGALLALPRDETARRFGQPLLDSLDRALGRLPAPRRFFTPPACFDAKVEFAAEVIGGEALLFAAKRLLTQLAGFLCARNGGIQRCTLTLLHDKDFAATTIDIGLVAPTRDAAHMTLLARERLAAFTLPAPVQAIVLEAGEILELAQENSSLFPEQINPPGEREKLIERLRARLGRGAVGGVVSRAGHRPERAWQPAEPGTPNHAPSCGPRPLWLLEAPRPLPQIAAKPHYGNDPLALIAGPERIESGWWDSDDIRRDYFIARTAEHSMLWVYRDWRRPGGWYLHGIFG
jgi:protein ImuB